MSETVLRILVEELHTVRIICDRCKTAVEVPIDLLGQSNQPIKCPGTCGGTLRPLPTSAMGNLPPPDGFHDLAAGLRALRALKAGGTSVEFVLPVKPESKP